MGQYTGAGTQMNSQTMLPNQNTILAQGQGAGTDAMAANAQTQKLQMSKYMSAYGVDSPSVQAAVGQGIDNGSAVATQNFQARMAEANVRSQIHQTYMAHMWNQFNFQKKKDMFGLIGAGLGAVGLAGTILAHPDTPGAKFQSDYTDQHIGIDLQKESQGGDQIPTGTGATAGE